MSIEYKPIYCPVCSKFYFPELQDDDNPEAFQCLICGWKYNLPALEFPDEPDKKNGMSLNAFRIRYQSKLAENPEYNYMEENTPSPISHSCPICGKYKFKDESSYDICPMCGWEDDGSDEYPDEIGINDMSFTEYRKLYRQKLFDNPDYHWEK